LQTQMLNTVENCFRYRNETRQPQVFCVEPWGSDFTVLPGQQLRLEVSGDGKPPHFDLQHSSDGFQLWCEAAKLFDVFIDGARVECGHQRGEACA
jgi:hypothetical protein